MLDDLILPGNQMYMNEFSSIYQASEDLMDHCVLAETNGNFQDAIRHCSQAIGMTFRKYIPLLNCMKIYHVKDHFLRCY